MLSKYPEIGSEFWIESVPDALLTERDGVYVLSGRTAIDLILQDILKNKPISNVYLPAWCCDSMLAPFQDRGVAVRFYDLRIENGLQYVVDETTVPDLFYLSNYFGYDNTLSLEIVRSFKEKGSIILYDRTHSFLREDDAYCAIADYSFASIRKWMGVVGGAEVIGLTNKPNLRCCPFTSEKETAMKEKYRYLQGDAGIVKQCFLDAFGEFGHHLSQDYRDYEMDALSYTLYKQEDFEAVRTRRKENAAFLQENLKSLQFLSQLTGNAVPLFVPVLFNTQEKRDAIRRKLISAGIFCPIHWPKPQQISPCLSANVLYSRELSLICDQRYGLPEMQRIVELIQNEI